MCDGHLTPGDHFTKNPSAPPPFDASRRHYPCGPADASPPHVALDIPPADIVLHPDLKANLNALNTCAPRSSLHICIDIVITKRQCIITKVKY
jgi:hypothetical protein